MPEQSSLPRIASLLPSATEIVCALGLRSHLVARSHECDFPSSVKKVPSCTSSLIDSTKSSRIINTEVEAHLKQGLSLFDIDWEVLRRVQPTVLLTQSHCDVCAVNVKEVQRWAYQELGQQPQIIDLAPHNLADVWRDIARVAQACGVSDRAVTLVDRYQHHVANIANQTKNLPHKPVVVAFEWIDPLMTAGNWVPELIELAGGIPKLGLKGGHSGWIDWAPLRELNPEIIVVLPCGFDIDSTRAEMAPLTVQPGWYDLKAVQNNCVFLLDGNQFFNRPGPRLVESLEILAEVIQPELFDFGHKLENWQYWGFNRVV